MQVEINPRGNGACPLCGLNGGCRVREGLAGAMSIFSDEDDPMELVVYSCPRFQEKADSGENIR